MLYAYNIALPSQQGLLHCAPARFWKRAAALGIFRYERREEGGATAAGGPGL